MKYKIYKETEPAGYEILIGPHKFECGLTDPEDRTFSRDLKPVVDRLNAYEGYIKYLKECIKWENSKPQTFTQWSKQNGCKK